MTETVDPTRAVIALNQSYLAAAAELCRSSRAWPASSCI